MNEPGETVARPAVAETVSRVDPDSAASLVRILDQYLADVQAGRGPPVRKSWPSTPRWPRSSSPAWRGSSSSTRGRIASPARAEPGAAGRVPDHPRAGPRRHGRRLRGRADFASSAASRLKVLRFGVVADEEAMQRFQREAETVARLHHTNIVPIFAVGSERGVLTTPCSSSRAGAWPTSSGGARTQGRPPARRAGRALGAPGGRGAGACPPARGDPPRHQAVEPAARCARASSG